MNLTSESSILLFLTDSIIVTCLFIDYLNFVKKCMKQLQSPIFSLLKRIDVELTPLDSTQEQLIPGNINTSIYNPVCATQYVMFLHSEVKTP